MNTALLTALGAILAALIAIAGIVGTWAALRVGKNAQTLSNYRDALQSWKERSEAQDTKIAEQDIEIGDLKTQVDELRHENSELRGQIGTLRDAISGRQVFDGLSDSFARQHKELIDRLDKLAGGR